MTNYTAEVLKGFHEEVSNWANKYNVKLQQLDKKPIYYILGTV